MSANKQINGFQVLSHIGDGAASKLYAVHDPKSRQVWALKHVVKRVEKDQRFLDQVEAEYDVGARLDHPNIRGVHKIIRNRKFFRVTDIALLMELVDAVALDQRLPKTYADVADIFRQVASALAHMHEQGYVHADLKPSNVLVTEDRCVKLIDLGQSCPIGTEKKRIQGTPGYMAPEQAHRRAIVRETDAYNFGATLYWVLCREVIPTALPPKNDDDDSLHKGALDEEMIEPPIPPTQQNPRIPQLLSKLVLDCVEVSVENRPHDMRDIERRLELMVDLFSSPGEIPRMIITQADESTV